jgi:hypothetical protein
MKSALDPEWFDQAYGVIVQAFGPAVKWRDITQAIWRYFQVQPDEPLMVSAMQRISGGLGVDVWDVITIVQVLAGANPPLLETVFTRRKPETRELEEVPLTAVHAVLVNLSAKGALGQWANDMANQILLGWKPTPTAG